MIIDVWPEHAKLVDEATSILKDKTDHYIFISSIAVYADFNYVGLHESSQLTSFPADPKDWYYSHEKRRAEEIVAERFPERHTILRPGPITGWRDPGLDMAYWLSKLKRGADILAPGSGKDPIQFINVKDVANFVAKAATEKMYGIFNTTGPRKDPLLWDEFLQIAKQSVGSSSKIYWASEAFLAENKVRSFEHLPLWAPLSEDEGFMQISNEKASLAGFVYSPLHETCADVLKWF